MAVPLYDIHLGDKSDLQGYRLKQIVRDSAPDFSPRFGSGEQGESDLDLLKTKTVKSFKGGMFQRRWEDDEKCARVRGVFNDYDGLLYPDMYWAGLSSPATYTGTSHTPTARATFHTSAFVAHREGSKNYIHLIEGNGTVTKMTGVPSAVENASYAISDMITVKQYLFVAIQQSGGGVNVHRCTLSGAGWTDVTGVVKNFAVLRGVLYGIDRNSLINSMTNIDNATLTYTGLKQIGVADATNTPPIKMEEFNGAIWIAKPDGLFRFDGVDVSRVLDIYPLYLTPYNGALYYLHKGWLYRFDGSFVERLQYFGDGENVIDMIKHGDYLAIMTKPNTATYKYAGSDSDGTIDYRVYLWNGVGFQLIMEADTVQDYAFFASAADNLMMCSIANNSFSYGYTNFDFTQRYKATLAPQVCEAVTSEFDGGFANIFKSAEEVEVDFVRLGASDSIEVSYQYFDGDTWSSWITLGTITSSTDNRVKIVEAGSVVKLFKSIKIRAKATVATSSNFAMGNLSLRYTLQPRHRWRWQVGILAHGVSGFGSVTDRAGAVISGDANSFNNKVVKTIKSKTPVFMLGEDYSQTTASHNAAATSITVAGQVPLYTDPYGEWPLVGIKNANSVWEILQVTAASYNSGTDVTTLTIKARGYLGITAATINDDAEVRLAYEVYVTRLMRDAPVLDESTYNQQPEGDSQLLREFLIEVVEK